MSAPIRGRCHCGALRFGARPGDGPATARRRGCSLCARGGAVAVSARRAAFTVPAGAAAPARERFGTMTPRHRFCAKCGNQTRRRRRSPPEETGTSLACRHGHMPFLPEGIAENGMNHPAKTGKPRIVGRPRLVPEEDTG